MRTIKEEILQGERALFKSDGVQLEDCVFADGESPLKESRNITLSGSTFKWKYPLWYCHNVKMENTTLLETARSGIWYTSDIEIKNSNIDAPKTFRRGNNIKLDNVHMANAHETFWNCHDIQLYNVFAKGDYFGMNSKDLYVEHLNLRGNYCFDGAKNMEVHHSILLSKDAFWNCEDIVVYDSTIIGEYLGWNSKNITFINCTIESLQGLCYIEKLKLVNCKLLNTELAFEYSSVDAAVTTQIHSVMNPNSGIIKAPAIHELIMEEDKVDTSLTEFVVDTYILNNVNEDAASCIC